jgi:hypothetical protein
MEATFYSYGKETPAKIIGNAIFTKENKPLNHYMNTWLFKGFAKDFDMRPTSAGRLIIFDF